MAGGEALTRWGAFACPELEREYRAQRLSSDAAVSSVLLLVGAAGAAVFAVSDYKFFGFGREFFVLAAARAAMCVLSVGASRAARRAAGARALDRIVFAWSIVFVLGAIGVISTRPPTYAVHLVVDLLIVLSFYAATPLPLELQAAASVLMSAGAIAVASRLEGAGPPQFAIFFAFAFANILGAASALHSQRDRRRLFLAAREQARLRLGLERAMSEIKTLKGIVPICAHCKRVRDGGGAWHGVEAYVSARTDARFSHGVCPDCVERHYP